jgi:hypothetical protein
VVRCWWHRDGGEIRSPQIGSGVTPCGGRVGLGGKLQSYYFAFGEDDVVSILDLPDNMWMAAMNMTIGATGLVNTKTIVLLTPEEVDEDARKSVAYRAPGD